MINRPVLYTFRRCPYAIRARLAIAVSGIEIDEFEVDLRDKPAAMLAISPKGTVPVLKLVDGTVIEQSLDIMRWALGMHDPENWLNHAPELAAVASALVNENDGHFKRALDGYKYPDRFPAHPVAQYRDDGAAFLAKLALRLTTQPFLTGNQRGLADAAIVPFVRQFAAVDQLWFAQSPFPQVRQWLDRYLSSPLFEGVMAKSLLPRQIAGVAKNR